MFPRLTFLAMPLPEYVDVHKYFNNLPDVWRKVDSVEYFRDGTLLGKKFRADVEHGAIVFRCQKRIGYTTEEWQTLLFNHLPPFPPAPPAEE